jgi:hypothetical protein
MSSFKQAIKKILEAKTDFKTPGVTDWDTILDEPAPTTPLATQNKTNAHPDPVIKQVSDLKRGTKADTLHATSNIQHTDAMRDLMSKLDLGDMADMGDDQGMDDEEIIPDHDAVIPHVTPEQVPAVISREIAMTDAHAINPTWHTVSHLPGNMSRSILTLGKALFREFTTTPTEDIVMIGNVGGQGPNSTREVKAVSAWVVKYGQKVDDAAIDFDTVMPGYTAQVQHYVVGAIRFKLVKDQFGDYIYAWPESDSKNHVSLISQDTAQGQIGN